jgi:osmoprotectant transport system permease protein
MNLFLEAIQFIFTPVWTIITTERENDIVTRLAEHLGYTFISLIAATVIAVPIGYAIGHTGKGREIAVGLSGAARAIPSLGLLTILALAVGFSRGPIAAVIVFLVLGVPSILAGAYAGIESIDKRTIDAARAVGMTEWQILTKVEIPLGLPLLIGGIRNAALQIVATATLAAYIGLGGLGVYIFEGLPIRNFTEMLAGAILIAVLAIALDGLFAALQHFAVPRGVTAGTPRELRTKSARRRTVAGVPAESSKG